MLRIILVLAASVAAAPWCVQTQYGSPRCYYYDANECKAAAYKDNGICIAKSDGGNFRSGIDPSILNRSGGPGTSVLDGIQEGMEIRRRREAHRMQQEQSRQQLEIDKAAATKNQAMFEIELKAKSVAWKEAYPDQPNPYQEYIDREQAAARTRAIDAEAASLERQERHAKNRQTAFKLVVVGAVVTAGALLVVAATAPD